MTFFSIIIPTYNRAHLIAETIDSVLAQTHSQFEIIVVDDGSIDNTREVVESKYRSDSRVKFFYKKNEERGAARNYGMKQAKGDYAVFFDSDDRMKPDYLTALQGVIEKFPGIFLLAAKYNYSANGKTESHPSLSVLAEGWYDKNLFFKGNILACNYCIRIKDNNYKPYPEERELASMEDWLFLLRNLANEKIYIKDEICITMRQHDERSMMNNQKVIEARKKANTWAIENLALTGQEKRKLNAWSHYFCGIHQYLDHNRAGAVKEVLSAIKEDGPNKKFLVLLSKSIIGRKLIKTIR